MRGAGGSPAGTGPFGVGTPVDAPIPGGKVNRIEITGLQTGSRYIDPVTKDYSFDSYGRALGMDSVRQLAYLRIATIKESAAMKGLGNELHKVDRIGPGFAKRVDNILRAAFQDIVTAGLVEVVSITAERISSGRSQIRVKWRDLTTNQEHEDLI